MSTLSHYPESLRQADNGLNGEEFGDHNALPHEQVAEAGDIVIEDTQLCLDVGHRLPGLQVCLAFTLPTTDKAPENSRNMGEIIYMHGWKNESLLSVMLMYS